MATHFYEAAKEIINTRNTTKTSWRFYYLQLLDEFLETLEVFLSKLLHVGVIDGGVALAVRTDVFVYVVGFRLKDADASAVEPVLTTVAANIKSGK